MIDKDNYFAEFEDSNNISEKFDIVIEDNIGDIIIELIKSEC